LLSYTQVSLVVVCDFEGAMVGVITKTDIVQQIGGCHGSAYTSAAADVMTRNVAYCGPTDSLPDVLSMTTPNGLEFSSTTGICTKPRFSINARDALRALFAEKKYEESLLRDYVMGVGYR
jgi:CBS domain-containing protein